MQKRFFRFGQPLLALLILPPKSENGINSLKSLFMGLATGALLWVMFLAVLWFAK